MTKTFEAVGFDRYPYLKYSTAEDMTFKPAHKDTQHPAGQVINEEVSQKTLSDYIRSIKRAEAFDAVAAEKKLTFEEWYVPGYAVCEDDYTKLQETWYAALKHGTLS